MDFVSTRLIVTSAFLDAIVYDTVYAHDLADRLSEIRYPSGRIVAYARDGEGRVVTVTTKADAAAPEVTVASTIAWLPFGGLASLVYGNGHALALVHDLDYRATRRTVSGAAGTVQDLAYSFDAASNITAIADAADPARNQSFAYDALHRLTQAVGAYGAIDYAYDADGNRTARTIADGAVTVESYAYDALSNRLASVSGGAGTRSFTYDAAGNAITDDFVGGPSLALAYDDTGRLSSVDDGAAALAAYAHNAFGQRVRRAAAGLIEHIGYDRAGRRIAESDGLGATLREYIALDGMPLALVTDGGEIEVPFGQRVRRIAQSGDGGAAVREFIARVGVPRAPVTGGGGGVTIDYVHPDHLGAPQAMTDENGALTWEGAFRPFGEAHEITGPATNDQRFPGQFLDNATDYHYNYFRDYDPTTGRYLQSDPIGLGGGLSTYAYVGGNPVNRIDPQGLFAPVLVAPLVAEGGIAVAEAIIGLGFGIILGDILFNSDASPPSSPADDAVDEAEEGKVCLPDDDCEKLYEIDTATCNGITRIRGPRAGTVCHASASERFAACLAGRPIPPLNTWNN